MNERGKAGLSFLLFSAMWIGLASSWKRETIDRPKRPNLARWPCQTLGVPTGPYLNGAVQLGKAFICPCTNRFDDLDPCQEPSYDDLVLSPWPSSICFLQDALRGAVEVTTSTIQKLVTLLDAKQRTLS